MCIIVTIISYGNVQDMYHLIRIYLNETYFLNHTYICVKYMFTYLHIQNVYRVEYNKIKQVKGR